MRVVHLYGGNLYGGVERLLVTLAQQRGAAPGLEQEFALCYRGKLWRELEACGIAVHALGGVRASRPWQVRQARRRLEAWLHGRGVEVGLCHSWWPYAIFGPALRSAGVRVGLWMHGCASGRGWLERWAGRRRPDFALALGEYMAASLQALFPGMTARAWLPPVPLPPPLPASGRAALRAALQTPADSVVVLQVSRLEASKGQRLLLDALARCGPGWTAWIAGGVQRPQERRYLADLQRHAAARGVAAQVRWLGERNDVPALMQAADIFCQPNLAPEPFGMVFAEALAAGVPVVATHGGGASDLVDAACGILAAPAPEAVATALRALMDDAGHRAAMGAAGRLRAAARFDPTQQMQQWQALMHGPEAPQ